MSGTMRAAVIAAPTEVRIDHVPIPEPAADQVLVKLEGCGVCASNLPPWEGQPWFTYPMEPGALGHEAWGHVAALGASVTGFEVGDRVSILSGHGYAEYDIASIGSIVKLPSDLDSQPFPGEPLGCAYNIMQRSGIQADQTVAIVGIGFLGALLTRMATDMGAHVIAVAHRPFSQQMASACGAEQVVAMDDHWRIIENVKQLTDGVMCDVVVEATGKQWPLDLSAELTKEMGRLVIAGYHQDGPRQVNMQLWNWRGLDVINAHERVQSVYIDGITAAAQLVSSGKLDPSPLYTHTFALEELADALNATRDRPDGFLKALIRY